LFVESHSTTIPTAPVLAWLISSSGVKVPGVGEAAILTAYVPLNVVAEAAEPAAFWGSLIKLIFLKSFAAVKSPELELSVPSYDVFNITKNPPNSSIAFLPWPPFGKIITSNSAPEPAPPAFVAASMSAFLI